MYRLRSSSTTSAHSTTVRSALVASITLPALLGERFRVLLDPTTVFPTSTSTYSMARTHDHRDHKTMTTSDKSNHPRSSSHSRWFGCAGLEVIVAEIDPSWSKFRTRLVPKERAEARSHHRHRSSNFDIDDDRSQHKPPILAIRSNGYSLATFLARQTPRYHRSRYYNNSSKPPS
jgi:hypothetical protein